MTKAGSSKLGARQFGLWQSFAFGLMSTVKGANSFACDLAADVSMLTFCRLQDRCPELKGYRGYPTMLRGNAMMRILCGG